MSADTNVTYDKITTTSIFEQKTQSQYQPDDPNCIEFRWGYNLSGIKTGEKYSDQKSCDTLHTLYLLQCAMEESNFNHQYVCVQVITNLLDWHNENKWENNFDGKLLYETDPKIVIQNILGKIGGIPLFAAKDVYRKLKSAQIQRYMCLNSYPLKIKLKTYGYWKMYQNEKLFDECTIEDMIVLLRVVAFPDMIKQESKYNKKLYDIHGWDHKIIQYFRDNNLNGKRFMQRFKSNSGATTMCSDIIKHFNANSTYTMGGVNRILRSIKDLALNSGKLKAAFSMTLIVCGYLRKFEQTYTLRYMIPGEIKKLVSMFYQGIY